MTSRAEDITAAVDSQPVGGDAQPSNNVRMHLAEFAAVDAALERYLVIDEIWRSGTTVVWRAYDPTLKREVALREMRLEGRLEEAQVQILREAQAMAQLSHANIVAIYNAEIGDHKVTLAMESVRGATLEVWLAGRRPWRAIVATFIDAGRGLAAAHAAGVLHRDFRPRNVLVGEDARVRVTDFGLASIRDPTPDSTAQPETSRDRAARTRYMAPEQHDGTTLHPASDQYAFCAALWEALTDASPFPATDIELLVQSKRRGSPPWPRASVVPSAIRAALRRGLSPRPEDRWPSMEVLLEALAHACKAVRRWSMAVAMMAGSVTLANGWYIHQQRVAERCSGGPMQLTSVWDAERRGAVLQALSDSATANADRSARVVSGLDAYAKSWVDTFIDACEATNVRKQQSLQVMDLRMGCLQRARIDLRAATDLLRRADEQIAKKADDLVTALPRLARCNDIDALRSEVVPPLPEHEDAVETTRARIAETKALRTAGKFADAMETIEELAREALSIPYPPLRTEILLELGLSLEQAGKEHEAESFYAQGLRLGLAHRQWYEAGQAARFLVYNVGWKQRRPREALAYAETAKGLLEPGDKAARALLHTRIGSALDQLGRFREAEAEHRAAVALGESAEPGRPGNGAFRGALANNLSTQGRLQEAEVEHRKRLGLWIEGLGAGHPLVGHARHDLGGVLSQQGRYLHAEAQYRAAMTIWELALGPEHPLMASGRSSLGSALSAQGRFEEAEREWREALRIRMKATGAEDIDVALDRGVLATALLRRGDYKQAETETRAAISVLERAPGDGFRYQPLIAGNLAAALIGQGRLEESEAELREALATVRRVWGERHPYAFDLLAHLGNTLEARGRYEEAETTYHRVLTLQVEFAGAEHPHVATYRGSLANALRAQGRYDEAEAHYRESLSLLEKLGRIDHPDAAKIESGFGRMLFERGHVVAARTVLERAHERWSDDVRVAPPVRTRLATDLARALRKADRPRARASSRRAMEREPAAEKL